jgi:hypothetical protein
MVDTMAPLMVVMTVDMMDDYLALVKILTTKV